MSRRLTAKDVQGLLDKGWEVHHGVISCEELLEFTQTLPEQEIDIGCPWT